MDTDDLLFQPLDICDHSADYTPMHSQLFMG